MKNKVLATLMSVALFVGLAVPAFAENISSQSGTDSDIKTVEFSKSSYELANTKEKDMMKEFMALVSKKQMVQEPTVTWTVQNDDNYAFNISDDGMLACVENKGTATVIATVNVDGKDITAKTTVKATAAPKEIWATGFQFEDNKIQALVGAEVDVFDRTSAATQDFNIVAYPKDAKFTDDQLNAIEEDFNKVAEDFAIIGRDAASNEVKVVPVAAKGDNKVVVSYSNFNATTITRAATTITITTAAGTDNAYITIDGVKAVIADVSTATGADTAVKQAELVAKYYNAHNDGKRFTAAASNSSGNGVITLTAKPGVILKDTAKVKLEAKDSALVIADATKDPTNHVHKGEFTVDNTSVTTSDADNSGLMAVSKDVASKNVSLSVEFPSYSNSDRESWAKRSVALSAKVAKQVTSLNASNTITVEVGERVEVEKYFVQGPSSANIEFDLSTMQGLVDTSAQVDDYAIITGGDNVEVLGVAAGTNKIVGKIKLPNGTVKEAGLVVKVVERGTKTTTTPDAGDAALSFSVGSTAVGGAGFTISIKNAPEGAAITYKSMDEKIATVDASGKVTGVSAGTTKIEVNVNGAKLYCTVTVKAAAGGNTGTIPPATGVAVLAPLF